MNFINFVLVLFDTKHVFINNTYLNQESLKYFYIFFKNQINPVHQALHLQYEH